MTPLAAVARIVVTAFWLATAAYAFLASVPFVYEQFLQPGLVPALVTFARWHGAVAVAMVPLTALALWPEFAARRALLSGGGLVWVAVLAGVGAYVGAPLTTLEPGPMALGVAAASLLPVVWFAFIDLRQARWDMRDRPVDPSARDAVVVVIAMVAAVLLFAATGLIATRSFDPLGAALSLASHALLFFAVFAVFAIVRATSELTSKPAQWETLGAVLMMAALTGAAAAAVILPAVSQRDRGSLGVVVAFGATIGFALAARGVRRERAGEHDGIALVLAGLLPAWARSHGILPRVAWAAAILGVAVSFRLASQSMDWNFVVAKLGAVVVWTLVLATAAQWAPARVYLPSPLPYGLCAATLALYLLLAGRLPFGPVTLEAAMSSGDAWAIGDPSFRTLRDWLQRPVPQAEAVGAATGVNDPSAGTPFFEYLEAHTNIGRSLRVDPVPVRLADLAGPPSPQRPHVFVFVIDSLRRDYLSPYNDRVTFTPAVERFAAESTVFERAFTRYGATGLSVPSIWVGGMLLHKQYVTPFAPMNALHALLSQQGYARQVSMDNIVEVIMPRDQSLTELDARRGVGDFRLCSSLDDLRGRLDAIAKSATPTFVWSLPQDVHVAVLNREGKSTIDGESYDGFYAPYASRVRRLDGCFGEFISDLKARGLYDSSVVVLTADHGDSLGEAGRWGHAYTLYPEVVQVPLIMHMPKSVQAAMESRPSAPAFTTDITPTLYALLGHPPATSSPIFGQPLFWPKGTPPPTRPDFGLVASSYGSVYGWLDPDGRSMYIADGVALRDYVYDLDGSAAGKSKPVSASARANGQRAIRAGIGEIAKFYNFTPPVQ